MLQEHSDFSVVHLDFSESMRLFDAACDDLRNTALQVPPPMDPSEWIKEHIELPESKTYKPGDMQLTGYQRPIADAFMDPDVREIVVMKGTRVGWSVFIASMTIYGLAYKGFPIGIAQPTRGQSEEFYMKVLDPFFKVVKAMKAIRRKAKRGETQDRMLDHIFQNGSELKLVGAATSNAFRGWRGRWLFGDEYSSPPWADDPGDKDEGDKAKLLSKRGGEWADAIMALGSTPTFIDECRTYARWLGSDQRLPYIECPHCGLWQNMRWGDEDTPYGFKFKRDGNNYVTECHYQCESENACAITERYKYDIVENLQYRSSVPGGVAKVRGRVGFHIPQWLSMAGQSNWIDLAQEFVNSKGNPADRKTWMNTVAGWPYDDFTASSMDASELTALLHKYPAEIPDDVLLLTAGGDTQTNKEGSNLEEMASREIAVVGWNRFGQFRVIGHYVIKGAPGDPEADKQLRALLDRPFHKRDGTKMYIQATAIDAGGHFTDATRSFAATYPKNRNVWAIHGSKTRKISVWPKKVKRGATFYMIDSHGARDFVFHLMQFKDQNAPMIPMSMKTDYLGKLMCEERKKIKGDWKWVPKHGDRAEEEWMCLAYAYAALKGLQASYVNWTDLNLAAEKRGIPDIGFDPETGRILDAEQDNSAHTREDLARQDVKQLDETVRPPVRAQKAVPIKEQIVNKAPVEPMAAQPTGGGQQVKRRRSGGIIH